MHRDDGEGPGSGEGTSARIVGVAGIRASEKNLTIIQDNQVEPSLTLDGDPSRLRQVVTNLLSNALKFTDQGSVTVRTHWRPPRHQTRLGQLTVEVIDTGVGIASSQLANLFNMFVQVQPGNHRRYGGSGLGLAISKRLIELMGGSISVESTLGEGTSFAKSVGFSRASAAVGAAKRGAPMLFLDGIQLMALLNSGLDIAAANAPGEQDAQVIANKRSFLVFTMLRRLWQDSICTPCMLGK